MQHTTLSKIVGKLFMRQACITPKNRPRIFTITNSPRVSDLSGYQIENNARDFEIKGVPAEVIARFSKRHQQIDAETQKHIAAEGLKGNEESLREQIAHDKRRRKIKDMSAEHLCSRWAAEMSADEHAALAGIAPAKLALVASDANVVANAAV
jgi:hypothetical protein